ncbi:MAG: hypothetical protein PF517_05965 [Salinivirgaceae bacterium]|jgi:hypothetical protein|nr:hypothetical protein [Salinivirgaceae bacterium]
MKSWVSIFLFMFFTVHVSAQNHEMKKYLLDVEQSTLGLEVDNDVVFLQYRVEVLSDSGDRNVQKSTIVKSGDMVEVHSKNTHMYKDPETIVVIMHDQKQIIIIPFSDEMSETLDAELYNQQKDSLLSHCQVVSVDEKDSERKIVLKMPYGCMDGIYIKNMAYSINTENDQLNAIVTTYFPGYKYVMMKTVVEKFKRFGRYPFKNNALSYIFNKNNVLKNEYSNYTVNDNR